MNDREEKLLIYFESEEHLVRRLGAAVVSCWSEMPGDMRDKLLERATRVLDEDHSGHLDEQRSVSSPIIPESNELPSGPRNPQARYGKSSLARGRSMPVPVRWMTNVAGTPPHLPERRRAGPRGAAHPPWAPAVAFGFPSVQYLAT